MTYEDHNLIVKSRPELHVSHVLVINVESNSPEIVKGWV
jgi:hypothetical protein